MDHPRVWLITGTSSGFGRRLVSSVLLRGDRVIASARTIESIRDIFPSYDSDHLRLLELDVSADEETLRSKVQEALGFWGRIDVLVNNAGYSLKVLAEDARLADFQNQFQTNFYAPAILTNAVLPQMRSRKEGTIVMIGSRSSWNPIPATLYGASKAALRVYTEGLAHELSSSGFPHIRLIIFEPSSFRTEKTVLGFPMQVPSPNPDPAYDDLRARVQKSLEALDLNQSGDPDKAVGVIVDVVRGEGCAEGKVGKELKEWPLYVPLGKEANRDIEAKCKMMLGAVERWREVTDHLEFDERGRDLE
ncbi:NAD(P)-binding protein [Lentinula raphanica]|nr:NAD(P)-binding protein [Lentinula raphanica]